jgi:hypothetical protein
LSQPPKVIYKEKIVYKNKIIYPKNYNDLILLREEVESLEIETNFCGNGWENFKTVEPLYLKYLKLLKIQLMKNGKLY